MRKLSTHHGYSRTAALAWSLFCVLLVGMASSAATASASTINAGPMSILHETGSIEVGTCAYGLLEMHGDVTIVSMPAGSVFYASGQNDDGWVLNQGSVYIANGVQTISVNNFYVANARLHARVVLRSVEVSQEGNDLVDLFFSDGC